MNFNVNNESIMKKIQENNNEISKFQKNKRICFLMVHDFCSNEHLGHTILYLVDKLENFLNVELKTLKNKGSIMGSKMLRKQHLSNLVECQYLIKMCKCS